MASGQRRAQGELEFELLSVSFCQGNCATGLVEFITCGIVEIHSFDSTSRCCERADARA